MKEIKGIIDCEAGDLICATAAWNDHDINDYLWSDNPHPSSRMTFYSIVLARGPLKTFNEYDVRLYEVMPVGIPFNYNITVSSVAIIKRY